MIKYILKRLLHMIPVLLIISIVIFGIMKLAPGDSIGMGLDPRATKESIELQREALGLNDSVPLQYAKWLGRIITGDFGKSSKYMQPVIEIVPDRLWNSFILNIVVYLLAFLISIPIGIISAVKQYSISDYFVTALAFFGQSMPTFWTGLMAMAIFSVALDWFPTGGVRTSGQEGDIIEALARVITLGRAHPELAGQEMSTIVDGLRHVALPALVLTYFNMAGWARYTRASMLEVLRQDYMRTAGSKGLKERIVIMKHGLRNALIPLITILAFSIPGLFAGAIITETIFSWPGIGRMQIDAISNVDWPVVQGLLVIEAFLVIFSNLLADILYAVVDPRIRVN